MFNRRRCKNCGEKVSNRYNFCPYCRAPLGDPQDDENFGMLGRNDLEDDFNQGNPGFFSGITENVIGKMLSNAVRMLEKEMQREFNGQNPRPAFNKNIRLMINGKEIGLNGKPKNKQKKVELPTANSKKFTGLPKAEPKTSVRRLSDKVIYEMNMPGVKSLDDVSVSQLENSIEIKALGNKKVWQKIIPINFPIRKCDFSNRKLTIELEAKD